MKQLTDGSFDVDTKLVCASGLVGLEDVSWPPLRAWRRSWALISGRTILRLPLCIWFACSLLEVDLQFYSFDICLGKNSNLLFSFFFCILFLCYFLGGMFIFCLNFGLIRTGIGIIDYQMENHLVKEPDYKSIHLCMPDIYTSVFIHIIS